MHAEEKKLITKHLNLNKVMLEWGSGGSTIEFAPLVKEYYSIEHNKGWYDNVLTNLNLRNINNVNYNFIPENEPPAGDGRQSEYRQFKDYIDIVESFGTKFDIVLIDGRARRLCAKKIIPHLNEDAVVIIHDWVLRHVYHCVTDYYEIREYVAHTPQTIATFKLRKTPKSKAYDLDLSGLDRCDESERITSL